MTTYVITAPNGKEYEVDSPEGATQQDALSYFQQNWKPEKVEAQPEESMLSRVGSNFVTGVGNVVGSVVEPAIQMGTGFLAKPVSEIAGMAAAGREMISPQGGDPEAFKRSIAEQMTYQPRTGGGKYVSENILAPIGGAMGSGAEYIGEQLGSKGESPAPGRAAQEASMQALGFLGVKGAPKVGQTIREANLAKMNVLKEAKAADALRNSIRKEGQNIGLIAPAEGAVKETFSKIGGADASVSMKNRATMTNKLSEEVGLPKGAVSDADVLTRVNQLTKHYGAVEKALVEGVPITESFTNSINELVAPMKAKYAQDPKSFATLSAPIELLEQQLKQTDVIEPSIAMAKIRQLRSDARRYDKDTTGDPIKAEMSATNYKLANLYEDLIEKSLAKQNKTALLDSFRDARKKLSQIHVFDAARLPDGLIDPQKLASVVGKYGSDKRIVTGNFKTVSDFANTFKSVSKATTKSDLPTASRWEAMMALGAGLGAPASGGGSLVLATPMAARTIAPWFAERGMLQGKPANYNMSTARMFAPQAVEAGLLGTAFSPYAEEQQ